MNKVSDLTELSDQELVTQTLRDHISGEVDLTSAQVQSVNILAKASGMYTTRIEDVTPMSSEDLRDRLRRKLEDLKVVTESEKNEGSK